MSSASSLFDYLAGLEFFGIKLGLDQTRRLFAELGHPENGLRFLHVAGSNGKGSVCALLDGALRHAGYHTGFYSSPHLVTVNERFRIDGEIVGDAELADATERLREAADKLAKEGLKITYFEATTAIAAMLFAAHNVDYVIWETGMGGRLDATNIISPIASVITGISMEHAQYLGGTLAKIGYEKAGIIKTGTPLFCARTTPTEALTVIQDRAKILHAPCFLSERIASSKPEFHFTADRGRVFQTFHLTNGDRIRIGLPGAYQRRNAALAYTVLRFLAEHDGFDFRTALRGFEEVCWDARFQLFPERHLVMDGAHNPEGVEALRDSLVELYPGKKFHFLFGAFADKDTRPSLALLAPLALSFTFLHMDTRRSSKTGAALALELAGFASGLPVREATLAEALKEPKDPTVLCGSLHLCGDALAILQKK